VESLVASPHKTAIVFTLSFQNNENTLVHVGLGKLTAITFRQMRKMARSRYFLESICKVPKNKNAGQVDGASWHGHFRDHGGSPPPPRGMGKFIISHVDLRRGGGVPPPGGEG
jgi:hypothetical protein